MKRLISITLVLLPILAANAQLVEHYENPQRFQFTGFNDHSYYNPGVFAAEQHITYNPSHYSRNKEVFFSRIYSRDESHRVIYGVSIPIYLLDNYSEHPGSDSQMSPADRWRHTVKYYDTSGCSVVIADKIQGSQYTYKKLKTEHIRIGEAALIGNYFKMPDADSSLFLPHNSTYFPVIEVYFDQPIIVADSFLVGFHLPPSEVVYPDSVYWLKGPLYLNTNSPVVETSFYCGFVNDTTLSTVDPSTPGLGVPVTFSTAWGAPFPIVALPPCMSPIWMKVAEQHRMGVTVEWRAQYANTAFEVEYGPQGFAEGTGTTVGPIYANSQYTGQITLGGLQMGSDYTVRVRSFCSVTNGYSDWTELDFHTGTFYVVNTSTNNDEWGYVVGGGEYPADTTIRLFAYPRNEYHPFLNWSDGNNQNPRTVTVSRDTSFTAVFGNTEGIEGAEQPFITVCPNPANGSTELGCNRNIASWTLYDIQGRILKSDNPQSSTVTIDIHNLPPSVYILAIHTDKGTVTKKLVVK